MTTQQGFTLIELMIVVMIIAILAAIAIPAYDRYQVLNAEKEVEAYIGQLEIQLERWRAKNLTYQGFKPYREKPNAQNEMYYYDPKTRSRTVVDNSVIYVPLGSGPNDYRYILELVDGISQNPKSGDLSGQNVSLVPTDNDEYSVIRGQSWQVAAYPSRALENKGARKFMASSRGIRCSVTGSRNFRQLTFASSKDSCTGTGVKPW